LRNDLIYEKSVLRYGHAEKESVMTNKPLTIGHLAKAAGVNVETVRYYQRIGLITEPVKPAQGYRIYPEESLVRIKFIKRAQQLGFSLKEIEELLELGEGHCDDIRLRAEEKRTQVDNQIKDLKKLRATLNELIDSCHKTGKSSQCAIVETLTAN
jgi:MerR family mercuric resistance operon transcriptional regulator